MQEAPEFFGGREFYFAVRCTKPAIVGMHPDPDATEVFVQKISCQAIQKTGEIGTLHPSEWGPVVEALGAVRGKDIKAITIWQADDDGGNVVMHLPYGPDETTVFNPEEEDGRFYLPKVTEEENLNITPLDAMP